MCRLTAGSWSQPIASNSIIDCDVIFFSVHCNKVFFESYQHFLKAKKDDCEWTKTSVNWKVIALFIVYICDLFVVCMLRSYIMIEVCMYISFMIYYFPKRCNTSCGLIRLIDFIFFRVFKSYHIPNCRTLGCHFFKNHPKRRRSHVPLLALINRECRKPLCDDYVTPLPNSVELHSVCASLGNADARYILRVQYDK